MTAPDPDILAAVAEWISFADEDLSFARLGLGASGTRPFRLIAYHAQQCAEKSLKAYLVLKGVEFPYTHSIRALLGLCAEHAGWPESLRDAETLSPYAVAPRYPGVRTVVSERQAVHAVGLAARVLDLVRNELQREGINLPAPREERG